MEIRCSEVSPLSYMPQHVVLGRLMSMHTIPPAVVDDGVARGEGFKIIPENFARCSVELKDRLLVKTVIPTRTESLGSAR